MVPIIEKILGVHVDPASGHAEEGVDDCVDMTGDPDPELGVGLCDISQTVGEG